MNVYQTDADGFYVGITEAQPDPLTPGEFLIPGGAHTTKPPQAGAGQLAQMIDGAWQLVDEEVEPEPEPIPEPTEEELRASLPPLSKAQLQIGLAQEGWITEQEGRDWITQNTLPPAMTAVIDTLPAEQQIVALARAHSMSQAIRTDPLVEALGQAEGKTPEEIDTFWQTYAQV